MNTQRLNLSVKLNNVSQVVVIIILALVNLWSVPLTTS